MNIRYKHKFSRQSLGKTINAFESLKVRCECHQNRDRSIPNEEDARDVAQVLLCRYWLRLGTVDQLRVIPVSSDSAKKSPEDKHKFSYKKCFSFSLVDNLMIMKYAVIQHIKPPMQQIIYWFHVWVNTKYMHLSDSYKIHVFLRFIQNTEIYIRLTVDIYSSQRTAQMFLISLVQGRYEIERVHPVFAYVLVNLWANLGMPRDLQINIGLICRALRSKTV